MIAGEQGLNMSKINGFTLIELLIVMVIMGILVSIAYPTYHHHILKSRRSDGQTALLHLALLMEQYYTQNKTYDGFMLTNKSSPQGFYQLEIKKSSEDAYMLNAIPIGPQVDDSCKTLSLNNMNIKGPKQNCW